MQVIEALFSIEKKITLQVPVKGPVELISVVHMMEAVMMAP